MFEDLFNKFPDKKNVVEFPTLRDAFRAVSDPLGNRVENKILNNTKVSNEFNLLSKILPDDYINNNSEKILPILGDIHVNQKNPPPRVPPPPKPKPMRKYQKLTIKKKAEGQAGASGTGNGRP